MPFHDVELTTAEMIEFFPELNYWRDEPIADISGYGYYAVMKLASEHKVKVMLQGQGGDELFWGYPWVRQAVMQSLRKGSLRTNGSPTLMDYMDLSMPATWAPQTIRHFVRSFPRSLGRSCKHYWRDKLSPPDRLVFYDLSPDFEVACKDARTIYAPAFIECLGNGSPSDLFTHRQPWPQLDILITRLICQSYLLGNGISQGERLGMASSVEQRLPLIDYKLVETVIGLRKCVPDFQLAPKLWLKKAVEGLLPAWIMERPKRGFEPPYAWYEALFSAYGLQLVDGYLVQSGILRFDAAGQMAFWPYSRRKLLSLSFKALVLEMWCRQYSSVAVPV
jgi:asparagine synthase (glutamine-hydrolysing)